MDNEVSEEIPVLRGMMQGDPISPKSFPATIQEIFKNAKLEEMTLWGNRERYRQG